MPLPSLPLSLAHLVLRSVDSRATNPIYVHDVAAARNCCSSHQYIYTHSGTHPVIGHNMYALCVRSTAVCVYASVWVRAACCLFLWRAHWCRMLVRCRQRRNLFWCARFYSASVYNEYESFEWARDNDKFIAIYTHTKTETATMNSKKKKRKKRTKQWLCGVDGSVDKMQRRKNCCKPNDLIAQKGDKKKRNGILVLILRMD